VIYAVFGGNNLVVDSPDLKTVVGTEMISAPTQH